MPRPNAWGAQLSVSGYSGADAFSGVPVLVRLAENSPSGFSYSQLQSPTDGADLCFIDTSGNGLPFEIDTWNTSGESLVWVLLPTLESTTQFVMCWGELPERAAGQRRGQARRLARSSRPTGDERSGPGFSAPPPSPDRATPPSATEHGRALRAPLRAKGGVRIIGGVRGSNAPGSRILGFLDSRRLSQDSSL